VHRQLGRYAVGTSFKAFVAAMAVRARRGARLRGHETALAELFDQTAEAPTELQHRRLAGLAASVAERRGRSDRFRHRLAWPLAIAAAAATLYLAMAPPKPSNERARSMPTLATNTPDRLAAAAPIHSSSTGGATRVFEAEPVDPATHVLTADPRDLEPLDLGLLMPDDAETDG
jgi:hypothetical protein